MTISLVVNKTTVWSLVTWTYLKYKKKNSHFYFDWGQTYGSFTSGLRFTQYGDPSQQALGSFLMLALVRAM